MTDRSNTPSLEMWAGIECTVNRVGDRYFDQVVRSGHHDRGEDLERIAALGITTVRYPVLWERTLAGWSWPDARLRGLRELGLVPIVGLLHHGSGPPTTSLLDPAMPGCFAEYARSVARRYPWVVAFTPINEPLTTSRFSALYGHWYPHAHDDRSFAQSLILQCKATVLAMQAIREVTPEATLVMTEDLGTTHGTPALAYQVSFENERRWSSVDLVCGRLDRSREMWSWFRWIGIAEDELEWFLEHPCPPDIVGVNYYLTSERWLDEHVERWPVWSHGGNGRDRYADVHALLAGRIGGVGPVLQAAWERFQLPLAVTEVHLGCTRDEQLRWLVEIYDDAARAIERGVDVRAVTAWSMFGAYDWNSLCTQNTGFYEPGLYDVRGPTPRPTALARAVRSLAMGERPEHPVLGGRGFWHKAMAW